MLISRPRPQAAAALLAAALAVPTEAQVPPAAGEMPGNVCVVPALALAEDGPDTLLEIATEGVPRSLGARLGEGYGVVLDIAGCVPGPELSRLTFDEGLVSDVRLVESSGIAGPVTAVAVETRQPVEYTVTSSEQTVRIRLQPRPRDAETAAGPGAGAPAPASLVRVLEPLPMAPEEPEEPETSDTRAGVAREITALVESWARAWSDQRVEDYLAFYAAAFQPAARSRAEWEAARRERLAAPGFIEIGLDALQVRPAGEDRAAASFWQSYTSDVFSDLVYKTLTWTLEDGRWKILREEAGPAPESGPASAAGGPPGERSSAISKILEGARLSVSRAPTWDPTYRPLAYPGGDPGWQRGSGPDLVVRAFRHLGVDLQRRVHEDILADGAAYGVDRPDPNIDHRRLRNLRVFFRRHGEVLELEDWQPADLVFWSVRGREVDHVGIVSNRPAPAGHPLIIHHETRRVPAEEDVLHAWPVRAHYRWLPPAASP